MGAAKFCSTFYNVHCMYIAVVVVLVLQNFGEICCFFEKEFIAGGLCYGFPGHTDFSHQNSSIHQRSQSPFNRRYLS